LLNNFICYTFAPISDLAVKFYGKDFPLDWLITIFFITYVVFSFASSRLVEEKGLRLGVLIGTTVYCVRANLSCCVSVVLLNARSFCMARSSEHAQVRGAKP
jgi:hypothetical protein